MNGTGYVVSRKEAKQLSKQGYDVAAGQIVDLNEMPEWVRKRAYDLAKPVDSGLIVEHKIATETNAKYARTVPHVQLVSLARALGSDRDEEVQEMLGISDVHDGEDN